MSQTLKAPKNSLTWWATSISLICPAMLLIQTSVCSRNVSSTDHHLSRLSLLESTINLRFNTLPHMSNNPLCSARICKNGAKNQWKFNKMAIDHETMGPLCVLHVIVSNITKHNFLCILDEKSPVLNSSKQPVWNLGER